MIGIFLISGFISQSNFAKHNLSFVCHLLTVTGYLIANLAVADLSVGVLCIPFTILYFELRNWPFGHAMCKIIPGTQAMSVMASIGTLFAISIGELRVAALLRIKEFSEQCHLFLAYF